MLLEGLKFNCQLNSSKHFLLTKYIFTFLHWSIRLSYNNRLNLQLIPGSWRKVIGCVRHVTIHNWFEFLHMHFPFLGSNAAIFFFFFSLIDNRFPILIPFFSFDCFPFLKLVQLPLFILL